jgi:histidinol-phosphate/aromatic aminotransferase/cobyric acid decarboxylase-like protein
LLAYTYSAICNNSYPRPTPRRRLRRARRVVGVGHGVQSVRRVIGVGRGAQRIIGDVIRASLLPASQRCPNASHTTALARRLYW